MRLMRAEGLQARVRRRYCCTTMSEHEPADRAQPSRAQLPAGDA